MGFLKHVFAALLLFWCTLLFSQDYGLVFNGQEARLEDRTGIDLSYNGTFSPKSNLKLSFDFKLIPGQTDYYGYIFRILDENGCNIDFLYDQKKRENKNLKLVVDQNISKIGYIIANEVLYRDWIRVSIFIDFAQDSIAMTLDGQCVSEALPRHISSRGLRLSMGVNEIPSFRSTDVPGMIVKDIEISMDGDLAHQWSLDNSVGKYVSDKIGDRVIKVKNPIWLTRSSDHWSSDLVLKSEDDMLTAFDRSTGILYILTSQELRLYNSFTRSKKSIKLKQPVFIQEGGGLVYNNFEGKLYYYFLDSKFISTIDPITGTCEFFGEQKKLLTNYWQSAKSFSERDSSIYFFGGYGQLTYKKELTRFHCPTKTWHFIDTPAPSPRYLSSIFVKEDSLFLYGGYGSQSGNQLIKPTYNYDVYGVRLGETDVEKITSMGIEGLDFVPASTFVILPQGRFYSLIYSNYEMDTQLQLVYGRIGGRSLTLIENSNIPFLFKDIKSHVDLFYTDKYNALIAVKLHKTEDGMSVLDVLSRGVQDMSIGEQGNDKDVKKKIVMSFALLAVLILIGYGVILRIGKVRARQSSTEGTNDISESNVIPPDNAAVFRIKLLGRFKMLDHNNMEWGNRLTPLQKELFLAVLIYTIFEGGITSKRLDHYLWPDKSLKDSKNNRSVNLAKLRALLESFSTIKIIADGGLWKVTWDENTEVDLSEVWHAVVHGTDKVLLQKLYYITGGGLLEGIEYEWLDSFKSQVNSQLIDTLTLLRHTVGLEGNLEEEIIKGIFKLDSLNESALRCYCQLLKTQGKHSMAFKVYEQFVLAYKNIYQTDFPISFERLYKESVDSPI